MVPSVPVTVSEIDKAHKNLQPCSLEELYSSSKLCGDTFRTNFCVTRVDPEDVREFVKVYEKKTHKLSSAKGITTLPKGSEFVWIVQLLVKDASTLGNSNQYRILNYSHEGLGAHFFGKLTNLWSDANAVKRIEKACQNLQKFNVWIDAVVERKNGWLYIKDTKLRS